MSASTSITCCEDAAGDDEPPATKESPTRRCDLPAKSWKLAMVVACLPASYYCEGRSKCPTRKIDLSKNCYGRNRQLGHPLRRGRLRHNSDVYCTAGKATAHRKKLPNTTASLKQYTAHWANLRRELLLHSWEDYCTTSKATAHYTQLPNTTFPKQYIRICGGRGYCTTGKVTAQHGRPPHIIHN